MPDVVTLEFLAVQQRRILDELLAMRTEMAAMRVAFAPTRDDITVLTAMGTRQDNKLNAIRDLLQDMAAQLNRVEVRVGLLENSSSGK